MWSFAIANGSSQTQTVYIYAHASVYTRESTPYNTSYE
jgi:hypothetical protein